MTWVTWFSARVWQLSVFSVSSSVVHSLNRYITSLSDGATQFSLTGAAFLSPCASGVRMNVAAPPLASAPWQLAHCSDLALSNAGIDGLANSVAPRSTARFSKPVFSSAWRFGSSSQ